MDIIEIVFRAVGIFYAVGALAAIRSLAFSELIDRAIDMITLKKEEPKRVVRRWLLGAGGALTGTGGVALAVMSAWAVPLFILNLAVQAGWLFWAASAFPAEDEEDAAGRRKTLNAALGYAVMAIGVVWLYRSGRLSSYGEPIPAGLTALAATFYLALLIRQLSFRSRGNLGGGEDPDLPRRVVLSLADGDALLRDAETGLALHLHAVLPFDLAEGISAWHDQWCELTADRDGCFASSEAEAAHRAEAAEIMRELESIFGQGNVDGPEGYLSTP